MIVTLNNITKDYAGTPILEELSCQINFNEKVGIVGVNGSGKSTLIKVIEGRESIQKGKRFIARGTRIGYLEQLPKLPEHITVYEVLQLAFEDMIALIQEMKKIEGEMSSPDMWEEADKYERLLSQYGKVQSKFEQNGGYEIEAKIDIVSNGLGIIEKYNQPFNSLSGGEQTKVALAKLLLETPDLLLLDEPTNHLDVNAIEWLEQFVRTYEKTILIVSHDRYFLDQTVKRIMDIEDGKAETYIGDYSSFIKQKEERLLALFEQFKEQQKKITKMEAAIKQLTQWAIQGGNEKMHKRAKAMQSALDRIVKIDRPTMDRKKMALELGVEARSGKDVLQLEEVSKKFDRPLFNAINGLIRYNDKVCLVGENGVGKTTLLNLILGQEHQDDGLIKLGSQVKIGYLPQHVVFPDESLTIIDAYREEVPVTEGEARHKLAKFLFYGESVFKRCRDLSGGEKNRLRLAQLMAQETNFLIFDEPTNHLDIGSREVLEEVLQSYPGTILTISHDRFFINQIATAIWEIRDGKLYTYSGNYDDYRQEWQKRQTFGLVSSPHNSAVSNKAHKKQEQAKVKVQSPYAQKNLSKPKQNVEEVETQLILLEEKKVEMEKLFLDQDIQRDGPKVHKLKQELEDIQLELEKLYVQWTD